MSCRPSSHQLLISCRPGSRGAAYELLQAQQPPAAYQLQTRQQLLMSCRSSSRGAAYELQAQQPPAAYQLQTRQQRSCL